MRSPACHTSAHTRRGAQSAMPGGQVGSGGYLHVLPRRPTREVVRGHLPVFFGDLLGELPWWNTPGGFTRVEPAYPAPVHVARMPGGQRGRRLPSPQATDSSLA